MGVSQLNLSYGFLILFNAVFFLFGTHVPYVAKSVQMDKLHLAYSQTFYNVLLLLGTTFADVLMKRLNYKLVLALCFGAVGTSLAILANATSAWMIVVAQCLGIFMPAQQVVQIALVGLTKAGTERTTSFSRLGICFGLGFLGMPVISKLAAMFSGDNAPLAVSSGLAFAAVPAVLLFVQDLRPAESKSAEPKQAHKSVFSGLKLLYKDANLRLLFTLKILLLSPAFIVFGSMQIYLMSRFDVSQTTNSLIQLDIGLSIMFANSLVMSWLRRSYNEQQLIWIGACFCLVCYGCFCCWIYLFQIWFMVSFLIASITIVGNSADSLISTSADEEQQGLILGLSNAVTSVMHTLAPTLGMWLTSTFGFGSLGLVGMGATSLAILRLYSNALFAGSEISKSE